MPYVVTANHSVIKEKIERLAAYLSLENGFDGFMDWILQLRMELAIEHSLVQLGIDDMHIERLAQMATEDAAAGSNPILFTQNEYKNILKAALGSI